MNPTPTESTAEKPSDDLIIVEGLNKLFGLSYALRGLSFSIAHGEVVALLGPNGSGKTTLLRILSALTAPSGGNVTIGGWSLPREAAAVRAQLGVVAHSPLLYDDLSAEENLAFFAKMYGVEAMAAERAPQLLERVGLAKRAKSLVRTFSRGMIQRLALARALLHNPSVLLMDEPYTGLDAYGEALLDDLLREWKAEGRTVILAVHDIARAGSLASRAIILKSGRLAALVDITPGLDLPALFREKTA